MKILIAGLIIWTLGHYFKRLMPSGRVALETSIGQGPAKGAIALLLVISIVLMVIGYRSANGLHVYAPLAGIGI